MTPKPQASPRQRAPNRNLPVRRGSRMKLWWSFLAAVLVAYGVYTVWLGGAYRSVEPFMAGQCTPIDAPAGPEDILILPDGSGAIISAQDRRNRSNRGGLWFYDLSGNAPGKLTELNVPEQMPFHPRGIALHGPSSGEWVLQVINQRSADRNTVEVFALEAGKLRHLGSIGSDLFVSPNGIVATGPQSFYLTNDRGAGPRWMHAVENILQLSRSTVIYHDPRGTRPVAEDIAFANGIALTPDGLTALVGSTLWRMVLSFDREPASGLLRRSGSLALPGGVDNIRFDSDGAMWAALHVNSFAFIGHARDAQKESPSLVVRVDRDGRGATRIVEAFGDPGGLLSGASVAAHHKGRLLIGATFQPRIMDCRIETAKLKEIQP
ncbi:SMP-30/gluconolactonase/LRE family protein [Ferrovibrio sp. MS7]|uniref:strictosidine synthase family protein n=1 Tax=Ferrovibrio plantarum TaxID=3119164 RepID=UPI003136B73F